MTYRNIVGAIPASFLANCAIPGMPRVALAPPEFTTGAPEVQTAANMLLDKMREVQSFAKESRRRMDDYDARLADTEQKAARRGGAPAGPLEYSGPSIGTEVANSQALQEFKNANYRGTSRLEYKNTITTSSVGGALGGMVAPDRAGVQPMARRALTIRSLCKAGRTTSNQVTLMVQQTRTNAAAVAPEGTIKGEGAMTYVEKTFKVSTIATWVPVTRQVLDDAVGLQALVDSELRFNLAEREEDQLLYGPGTGDNLIGLMGQATAFAAPFVVTDATPFDRLLQALAQVSLANFRPSAIVLNTADAFALHSLKESGSGKYIAGGPNEALLNLLFGIPWVASNGLQRGDFLVGDFAQAEIYDKLDTVLEISDSHADFFVRNLYVLRCEQRLAFICRDARAFVKGVLTDPTT